MHNKHMHPTPRPTIPPHTLPPCALPQLRNNRVFVFGSDGDIWDLERGFTVRDAVGYGNHPSQGPVCDVSRVRVNGRFQRADYMLQNGDVVGSSEAQKA